MYSSQIPNTRRMNICLQVMATNGTTRTPKSSLKHQWPENQWPEMIKKPTKTTRKAKNWSFRRMKRKSMKRKRIQDKLERSRHGSGTNQQTGLNRTRSKYTRHLLSPRPLQLRAPMQMTTLKFAHDSIRIATRVSPNTCLL
jgi:hypothetical protein